MQGRRDSMAIALRKVSFSYGDRPVLDKVSLRFPEKGVLCLFGASGCGKTTILRLLAGLEQPDSGSLEGLEEKSAAVVFQENRLLPWLSVRDNVAAPLRGSDAARRADAALEAVGLGGEGDKRPSQLSGGMKRRAAIARALAAKADFLLLDEPFTGLNEELWKPIAGILRESYADRLIVLVTHNPAEAEAMGASLLRLAEPPQRGELSVEK